jgi:uncharacterized protein YecT (DUF1311 family)
MLVFASNIFAGTLGYKYKEVSDFKALESFPSVEAFEASYESYIGDCANNTGGGVGGVPCFIAGEMWDRELNVYYNRLISKLNSEDEGLLKNSQREWIKSRDLTLDFSSKTFWAKYKEPGSMYQLMGAADYDSILAAIVKQRVLWLKNRLELLNSPIDE